MSLHYILDGYNIVHQMPVAGGESLQDQREKLIAYLERQRPQGSANNQVTVVFDGQKGVASNVAQGIVRILFSSSRSADEKIKELVEEVSNRKNIIVVTDDRDVQYAVRALGAKINSVKDFLKKYNTGAEHRRQDAAGKRISKTDEFAIAEELIDIWIKKKDRPQQ